MKKRFLTLYWMQDCGQVHLFKDVGSIPFALSKYYGWDSTFAYSDVNGKIKDAVYEEYVHLEPIHGYRNNLLQKLSVCFYLIKNARRFEVINLYHSSFTTKIICKLIKLISPRTLTYIKLDLGKHNFPIAQKLLNDSTYVDVVDVFTIETKLYVEKLKQGLCKDSILYLPNGIFPEMFSRNFDKKENIIIHVARIGAKEKNSEMLIEALASMNQDVLNEWKCYMVGSVEDSFKSWFDHIIKNKPYLKNKVVFFGHLNDKPILYDMLEKSKIFVLTSNYESWGLALTEAMCAGCYPVVTDCCDAFHEMVINDNYGKIIPVGDANALAETLSILICENNILQDTVVKIHTEIEKNFSWEVTVKNLDETLCNLYEERI